MPPHGSSDDEHDDSYLHSIESPSSIGSPALPGGVIPSLDNDVIKLDTLHHLDLTSKSKTTTITEVTSIDHIVVKDGDHHHHDTPGIVAMEIDIMNVHDRKRSVFYSSKRSIASPTSPRNEITRVATGIDMNSFRKWADENNHVDDIPEYVSCVPTEEKSVEIVKPVDVKVNGAPTELLVVGANLVSKSKGFSKVLLKKAEVGSKFIVNQMSKSVDFVGRLTKEEELQTLLAPVLGTNYDIFRLLLTWSLVFGGLISAVVFSTVVFRLVNQPRSSYQYSTWWNSDYTDRYWLFGNVIASFTLSLFYLVPTIITVAETRKQRHRNAVIDKNKDAYIAAMEKRNEAFPVIFTEDWGLEIEAYDKAKEAFLELKTKNINLVKKLRPFLFIGFFWVVICFVFTVYYFFLPSQYDPGCSVTVGIYDANQFFSLFTVSSGYLYRPSIMMWVILASTCVEAILFICVCVTITRYPKKKQMAEEGYDEYGIPFGNVADEYHHVLHNASSDSHQYYDNFTNSVRDKCNDNKSMKKKEKTIFKKKSLDVDPVAMKAQRKKELIKEISMKNINCQVVGHEREIRSSTNHVDCAHKDECEGEPYNLFTKDNKIAELALYAVPIPHLENIEIGSGDVLLDIHAHDHEKKSLMSTDGGAHDEHVDASVDDTTGSMAHKLQGILLIEDTCLLIACHNACITYYTQDIFEDTLRHALQRFPPSAVFVIDNNDSLTPTDPTRNVCQKITREFYPKSVNNINYIYLPENNNTLAMYWCTELWIPTLVARGICQNFTYAMIIDSNMHIPRTLVVPFATLESDPDIMCVAFAARSVGCDLFSRCEDVVKQIEDFHSVFQYSYGSALGHRGISLWRRSVLGDEIFYRGVDGELEGMMQGILLHGLQKNYKVYISWSSPIDISSVSTAVDVFFRHLKHLSLSYCCSPFLWWNGLTCWRQSYLILKPYILLDFISVISDLLLVIFCCQMLTICDGTRLAFLAVIGLLYGVRCVQALVFNYYLQRNRRDLKTSFFICVFYPFYHMFSLLWRQFGLMDACIRVAPWTKPKETISERLTNRSLIPLPPVPETTMEWPYCKWTQVWAPSLMMKIEKGRSNIFDRRGNTWSQRSKKFDASFSKGCQRTGALLLQQLIPEDVITFIRTEVCGGEKPMIKVADVRSQIRLKFLVQCLVCANLLYYQTKQIGGNVKTLGLLIKSLEVGLLRYVALNRGDFKKSDILFSEDIIFDDDILKIEESLKNESDESYFVKKMETLRDYKQKMGQDLFSDASVSLFEQHRRKRNMSQLPFDPLRLRPIGPLEVCAGISLWWSRDYSQLRLIPPSVELSIVNQATRRFRLVARTVRVLESILYCLGRLNEPSRHDRVKEARELLSSVLLF